MSPGDIELVTECLKYEANRILLEQLTGMAQKKLYNAFYQRLKKETMRFVLDDKVVTLSLDCNKVKIHTSPVVGVFKSKTPSETVKEWIDGEVGRGFGTPFKGLGE